MSTLVKRRETKSRKENRLNVRQKRFVEELLADPQFDISAAAKKAGYGGPSGKNAPQAANKLLKNPIVNAYIGKRVREREKEVAFDATRVLRELGYVAFFDPADLFEEDGTLKPISEMGEEARRAISSIEVEHRESRDGDERTTVAKVRMNSKISALELVARHLGMLNDKLSLDAKIDQNVLVALVNEIDSTGVVVDGEAKTLME